MALSQIKKSAFQDTDSVFTTHKGWDVYVSKSSEGYHVSVFLPVEPDESDKAVVLAQSVESAAILTKLFAEESIDEAPITAAQAMKLAQKHDFGTITLTELINL